MNLLSRLSIVQITIFSGVLFLLLIFALLLTTLSNNYQSYAEAEEDILRVALLDSLEKIAHNHAVERGLTAGFLGSKSPAQKQKVDAQRLKADQAVNSFSQQLGLWRDNREVNDATSLLLKHLQGKAALRKQVDAINGKNAFSYYSKLNRLALDAAASITLELNSNEVATELNLALNFAQIKERLGQVRGKVNGVLARRAINAETRKEISGYMADVDIITEYLTVKLHSQLQGQFKQAMNEGDAKRIKTILAELSKDNTNYDALPPSSDWFPLATAQIGAVKKLLDAQWLSISNSVQNNGERQLLYLWLTSTLSIVFILVIFYLNVYLYKTLNRQLYELSQSLERIATERDLTTNVELDSNNELGIISRAIKTTIGSIMDLIVGLESSIKANTRMSHELDQITTEMLKDADSTQVKSTNIAAAIEQMANTSDEISRSAVETLEASNQLNEFADHAITINQQSMIAMTELDSSMIQVQQRASTMEKQVQEISGILETINGLSDQTNLLALNAAIEAARAGEQGRGFAVVADEVRSLAKASRTSSDQISALLLELQQASDGVAIEIRSSAEKTQTSLNSAQQTQEISEELKQKVGHVEQMSSSVSAAAEQQSVTSNQIAKDINAVLEGANRELEVAKHLRKMFDQVELNSETLQRTMDAFKIE